MSQIIRGLCVLTALTFVALISIQPSPASAENAQIAKLRAAEKKDFTDEQIIDGFFKIAFGAEFNIAGRIDRIRKYEKPIRVYVHNRAKPDRSRQVAATVADIRARVNGIDIAMVDRRSAANVVVTLVRDRDLGRTIRKYYGAERARQIQQSLEPQCLSGFSKDEGFRIQKSDVFIVSDAGEFIFYDCVYEELLQALGPINDDESIPWTMFNDDVQMGFFGIYDQYLLNILYHPDIRAGMSREDVKALLPKIMPQVRAFVAKTSNLPN